MSKEYPKKPPDPPDGSSEIAQLVRDDANKITSDMDIEYIGFSREVSRENLLSRSRQKTVSNQSFTLDKQENEQTNIVNTELLNKASSTNINSEKTVNTESSLYEKKDREICFYELSDKGPYIVYVQSETGNIGRAHILTVAKLINSSLGVYSGDIVNISSIGINRVKVEFSKAESANKLVNNSILKGKKYNSFIPKFLIRRQGVIRNIDLEFTEDELKQSITPIFGETFNILGVRRLNRKHINGNSIEYLPSTTVLVTFKGNNLPSKLAVERVVFGVEPYIQKVVQCLKCLRYGHIKDQCKGQERCSNCGGNHDNKLCPSSELYCIICQGNHKATDNKVCPEFQRQKSIKTIMGSENMSYKEAITKYDASYANVTHNNITKNGSSNLSSTIQNKRKRLEIVPGNSSLQAHKDILSLPKTQPPRMEKYTTAPQYHRQEKNKALENLTNVSDLIVNLVMSLINNAQSFDWESVNSLKENILHILTQNASV